PGAALRRRGSRAGAAVLEEDLVLERARVDRADLGQHLEALDEGAVARAMRAQAAAGAAAVEGTVEHHRAAGEHGAAEAVVDDVAARETAAGRGGCCRRTSGRNPAPSPPVRAEGLLSAVRSAWTIKDGAAALRQVPCL